MEVFNLDNLRAPFLPSKPKFPPSKVDLQIPAAVEIADFGSADFRVTLCRRPLHVEA